MRAACHTIPPARTRASKRLDQHLLSSLSRLSIEGCDVGRFNVDDDSSGGGGNGEAYCSETMVTQGGNKGSAGNSGSSGSNAIE